MKRLNNLSKLLFYFGYFLVIFSDMYDNIPWFASFSFAIDILSIVSLGFSSLLNLVNQENKITKQSVLWGSIFTGLVLITSIVSNDRTLIKLPFLFFSIIGMNFSDIISHDAWFRGILLTIITILSLIGVNGNTVLEYRNGLMRNSFGLGHSNAFGFELSILCADVIYLSSGKNKIFPLLFSFGSLIFNVLFLGSRTNMLLVIVLILLYIYKNKLRINNKIIKIILRNLFILCIFITLWLVLAYRNGEQFGKVVNDFLSRRLFYGDYFLNKYGITMLGSHIDDPATLDNAFLNLIIRYGVLLTSFIAVMYNKTFKKIIDSKQALLALYLVVFLLYGLSETPMYAPGKNPYTLLLACSFLPLIIDSARHNSKDTKYE